MTSIDNRLAKLRRKMLIQHQTDFREKLFDFDYLSELMEQEYSITVNSPEEFRRAIIEWCSLCAYKLREIQPKLKHRDRKKIAQELRAYEMMVKFWNKVKINGVG
jgi:hypothetical protein